MKKMWKRFVSLLLVCTLLAGMLPLSASAAEKPGEGSNQYQYAKGILDQLNNELGYGDSKFLLSPAAPLGGDSDLFTYVISRFYIDPVTNEGTTDMRYVIVPGVGASDTTMPNYSSAKDGQPWAKAAVSTFYIAKGVTGIGSYAFASQPSLNNVVFQDASDLTYIGQRAFYDDDNAVFTDEGNEDKTTTLDLSNVKKMGEYAFYNCDKLTGVELGGSITAVETVEGEVKETEYKIPSHAFTSTGVQSITVPSGIKKVGEYAFYDCPLNKEPYISLQEGLETIGNYAFGKNDAAPNTAMSSLTIPSSVESIGDHAFYNYTGLQTVTVLGKDNGGAGASALTHVGGAAFGDADHNAYSTTTTIQDAVHPEIEYTGLVGTQFYLPKELEKNDNLFVNGETCYTGNISPLTFELTVPATCTTDGYNQYYQTAQNTSVGGEPLTLHVRVKIPALGHDWDKGNPVNVPATCTNDAYTYEVCKNDKTHHRTTGVVNGSALGHSYEVTDVDQPAINADNATATIVTYTCENYNVVPEENKHDGQEPAQYQWTIPATTLEATTTDSLADIASQLPKPQGSHAASLEWAEDDTFSDLEEGEKSYHVRLKVNHATFAGYSDDDFTIRVKVSKAKLDFSDVRFVNADRWIDVENEDFDVEGLPEGVNQEPLKIEYKLKSAGDEVWSENKPSDGEEAKYVVRVTFTYDNTKYQLVTDEKELLPPSEYTLDEGTEANTGTIIGDYTIAQLNMDNIVVETPSLTFNGTSQNPEGTPQNTIRLNGVPEHSKVTFSWGDSGEQVIDDTGTNPLVSGAAITDAGTYTIHVKIEKETYKDFERDVRVTIAPQTLTTPTATTSPTYEPGETRTGVPYDNDDRYTMEGNTGINAGDYTAKAQVYNANNYVWSTGDTNQDGTVEIPWKILYKLLPKPTIQTAMGTVTYDGEEETPVSVGASSGLAVSYEGDVLQAKYKDELAYTATNAKETDANDYTVTVQLKNKNYKWSDQTDGDITLSWKIEPKQIKAPTVTVANKVYDGKPYNTDGAEITNLVHSDDSAYILELGADHTYYEGHAKLESAPTNAGNYAVEVDFDFVEGQKETNYQIVQNARQPFTITPAEATMEFSQKEVSAPYTAEGTTLQQVKVTNLVTVDVDKPASDVYTVTYTYKYRADDESEWENEEHKIINPDAFVFMDVGQYQITAKWGAGTVSNNYTAKDAIYTLTIKKAEDQSITLASAETNKGQWNEENKTYTTTYGAEASFTITGTAALDEPVISYKVKDDSEKGPDGEPADVLTVGSDGKVTIHQAGTATITVTAAETPNVGADSVDYTVTVNQAKPTVSLTDNKLEVSYTGKPITGYDIAEPTANVVEGADQPTGDITYTFYTDSGCQDKVTTGGGTDKNVPIAVGTYYMKATYPGDKNYTSAESEPVTVTVTKAQLTVDAEGHTGTYDGSEHKAITVNSVTGNDTQLAEGNYTVKYAKTTEEEAPAATAENVWKDALSVKDVADSSSDTLYYWYMVQDTAGNYEPKIEQVNVSITPAALNLNNVPDSYSKTYDGKTNITEDLSITVTTGTSDAITVSNATGTYDNENAGKDKTVTLTLTLSGTEIKWDNYSYNGAAPTDGKITLTKDDAGTINPKEITVTGISAVDRVYDGTKVVQLTGEPETEDTLFNEDGTVFLALAEGAKGQLQDATAGNGKAVSVGNDAVEITGEGSGNYSVTVSLPNLTVDIKKATPTVTITGASDNKLTVAYTGNPVNIAATVAGISDTDKPTGEVTFRSYESAGAAQNDTTGTGGTELEEMPSNGGPYYLRAFIAEDTNYKAAVSDYVELVIDATALSVTTGEPAEKPYTGKEHNMAQWADMKVQFSGKDVQYDVVFLKKGEDETSAPDAEDEKWNSGVSAITNVAESGEYWYKVTAKEGEGNFNPHVSTSAITFTVTPATLTINRAVTPTKTYDGTVDADEQVTDVGVKGQQNNEAITATVTSAVYNSAEVGSASKITITYKLEAKDGANLANYKLNDKEVVLTSGTVTEEVTKVNNTNVAITQKPIEVSINDQSKVYDGQFATASSDKETAWTVNEDDLCELVSGTKDNLGITLSVAPDSKNAGTYAITGAWTNNNYAVTFAGSWKGEEHNGTAGTYTIDPRPIDVQIGDTEGFYGDVPVLDNVALDDVTGDGVSDAGLVDGEVLKNVLKGLELATTANAQSDISDEDTLYTIYAKKGGAPVQAPTQLGNYNVTFTNEGTYTVKPRPITITIEDHSSVYGEKIDGGIADPDSGEDYTVAITEGNTVTGGAIVNGDNLEIKLTTEATADSPVDDYDITGSAAGEKVNNYAITWAGNGGDRDDGGKNGKYTIKPAQLEIAFTQGNQVTNGVSINIQDSYNDNSLVLENASTNVAVSEADKATLDITYSIGAAGGGAGGVSQIAEIDETTGEVTILKTGTVRITATVTPQGNSNYTGQVTTWYELNIISGGQITLTVTKNADLVYNGSAQKLLQSVSCSLDGADLQYKVDDGKWTENEPTGTNAGNYTVYVKATDPSGQYSDVTEHVMVTIDKATLEGSFAQKEYTHVLTTGTSYDSANKNPLTITSQNYKANPANYTYYSDNMKVASSANGTSTIVITGTAGQTATIRVTVPGDDNYNGKTFTYTLEISEKLSEIKYSVENDKVTYNGQPQTIAVNVTAPASGATVRYWNESTNAYDQTEPPAYTDVQDSGTTIKFQITAPGYKTVTDEATLTIKPRDINLCQVEGIAESYTFVNKPIEPQTVEVVDGSVILTKNTDYTLEYGANQEVGEDTGTVIIKGTGNYTGEVIEHFDIIPVDGSSGITASIAPNFGTYDPDAPVTAEVTVTHQTGTDSHEVTLTAENASYTITATDLVTGDPITERGATGTGNTLTFTKPAIYDITLTLTGDHRGEFHLSYTLLPLSNEDGGLTLTVDDETQKVFTYGDEIDSSGAAITVTADGNIVTDQCTLTYEYTGFDQTTVSGDYSPSVLKNAGVYTVTATPTEGSTITGTGTFTFLILQRDLADAILDVDDTDLVFNHDEKRPSVTVTVDGNAQPTKDADYTITYYNSVNASNAAKAVVTATGNNFTGSKTEDFTIAPKPITECVVKDIPDQYYTGNEVIPPVTITDGNYTLILGYDYTTACEDKGPGAATVTIKGTGNYTGEVEKTFTIQSEGAPEPSERFDLAVTPSQWTWGDDLTNLDLSVTFGTGNELALGTDYTLTVDGETASGEEVSETFDGTGAETPLNFIKSLKPGTYTITATGTNAYKDSKDTETVTVKKIQPELTVTAAPETLSGGGKVTLTLKGEKLPAFAEGQDLSSLLTASAKDEKNAPDLSELEWETDKQTGVMTAELTLPNTSETYTFTLTFTGNEYYEAATASEQVVVAQQIISGGGGGPVEDQPADPDDTGVSDWLNTKDHLAYLAGYPGGTFGPDQNMTRAEAAQMFYNLLLEKDVEITVEFEDVPADAWYAKPVNTLASLGILSGVGNGRFDPERSITRAEFTVIAMKFANTSGGGVNIFSDVNEDDWFYSAVVDSTQYGWINGYPDGTFRPEATISRAEVTVIVNHMLGRAADRPYVIAHEEELNTFGDVNRGHWGYFHVAEATNAHEYHTEDGTESWTGLS